MHFIRRKYTYISDGIRRYAYVCPMAILALSRNWLQGSRVVVVLPKANTVIKRQLPTCTELIELVRIMVT